MDLVVLAWLQGSPGVRNPSRERTRWWLVRRGVLGALRIGCAILALLLPDLPHPRAAAAQPAERRTPLISVDPPSDAAIKRRIEDVLAALGGTEDLDVEVRSGIVRLRGRADNLALREQASDLAERVDGVVLVRNEVQVASDVRGRLGPTWAKVNGYLTKGLGFLPVLAVALVAFIVFAILASAIGRWERPFRRLGLSHLGANILRIALRAMNARDRVSVILRSKSLTPWRSGP